MPSLSPPALQRLRRLNKTSLDFHDRLSSFLYEQKYVQCVQNLQGGDLAWLVGYLDKALDYLDPSGVAFQRCLRELRRICSTSTILPKSYSLLSDLLETDPDPFASGGYGDVYEGILDGSRACVKRVRVYTKDNPKKASEAFCQEAVMWRYLKHPNIVPFLGVTSAPRLESSFSPSTRMALGKGKHNFHPSGMSERTRRTGEVERKVTALLL